VAAVGVLLTQSADCEKHRENKLEILYFTKPFENPDILTKKELRLPVRLKQNAKHSTKKSSVSGSAKKPNRADSVIARYTFIAHRPDD
jgi:hypothetical protein